MKAKKRMAALLIVSHGSAVRIEQTKRKHAEWLAEFLNDRSERLGEGLAAVTLDRSENRKRLSNRSSR